MRRWGDGSRDQGVGTLIADAERSKGDEAYNCLDKRCMYCLDKCLELHTIIKQQLIQQLNWCFLMLHHDNINVQHHQSSKQIYVTVV